MNNFIIPVFNYIRFGFIKSPSGSVGFIILYNKIFHIYIYKFVYKNILSGIGYNFGFDLDLQC